MGRDLLEGGVEHRQRVVAVAGGGPVAGDVHPQVAHDGDAVDALAVRREMDEHEGVAALEKAPALGCETFILSAPPPFATEEAEALKSVVSMAATLKPKKMNEQIALLSQMDKDGVLEAYILMAIPDRGIAQDHRSYLLTHRDKLKLYVAKYVIQQSK